MRSCMIEHNQVFSRRRGLPSEQGSHPLLNKRSEVSFNPECLVQKATTRYLGFGTTQQTLHQQPFPTSERVCRSA